MKKFSVWALLAVLLLAATPALANHQYNDRYDNRYSDRYDGRYSNQATIVDVDAIRPYQQCRSSSSYGNHYGSDRNRYDRYDRYDNRYDRNRNNNSGAVIGALIGGAIGNEVGDGRHGATIAGAVIGGAIGREVGNDRHDRYDNRYGYGHSNNRYCVRSAPLYRVTYRYNGRLYSSTLRWAPRVGSRVNINTLG